MAIHGLLATLVLVEVKLKVEIALRGKSGKLRWNYNRLVIRKVEREVECIIGTALTELLETNCLPLQLSVYLGDLHYLGAIFWVVQLKDP
jgi:hypothetical protein